MLVTGRVHARVSQPSTPSAVARDCKSCPQPNEHCARKTLEHRNTMLARAKPNRSAARQEGNRQINERALDIEEETQENDLRHRRARGEIDELGKEREEEQCHLRVEYVGHDALSKDEWKTQARQTRDIAPMPGTQQEAQAKHEQINRSKDADDVVSEGHGSEERREAERKRCHMEQESDRNAERGEDSSRAAVADAACSDIEHVRAWRQIQRKGRAHEQKHHYQTRHTRATSSVPRVGYQEFLAQAWPLRLVPLIGVLDVSGRRRSDDDLLQRPWPRIRPRTSSQGMPTGPSRFRSSRRRSSSARWAPVSGIASGVAARLSHSSSSRSSRSSGVSDAMSRPRLLM